MHGGGYERHEDESAPKDSKQPELQPDTQLDLEKTKSCTEDELNDMFSAE